MSHARLRFVAAGAAAVTGLAGLALAPGAAQGAGAASRAPGQLQREDTHEQGVRRRGHLRRPRGLPDRPRGAPQGRQRGRRRGRDGGGARRHRAVQRRHRRRRLLRPLRRAHRQGRHDRRPRDRAAEHAARRVHRPGDRRALPDFTPRAGHQRRLGRHAGHPGHLGEGAATGGAPPASARRCARRRSSPTAASWSTRPSTSRPRTTSSGSRSSPTTSRLFLPGRQPAAGRLGVPQPRPRRHLPADRRARHGRLLRRPARAADRRARCRTRRRAPTPTLPVPPGYLEPSDLARYDVRRQAADASRLPGLRRLRDGARPPAAAPPSARR